MTPPGFRFAILKLLLAALVFVNCTLRAQDISATWSSGSNGNWNDGSNWSTSPDFPNDASAQSYSVSIDAATVFLNQDITIDELTFGGHNAIVEVPAGSNTLNVRSKLTLNQGLLSDVALSAHGALNAQGAADISGAFYLYGWHLSLAGNTAWTGALMVGDASVIDNLAGGRISLSDGAQCDDYAPDSVNPNNGKRVLNNYGTIDANAAGRGIFLDISLNNYGALNVNSGTLTLEDGGSSNGTVTIAPGATLDFEHSNFPTVPNFVFDSTSSIAGNGSIKFNSACNFYIGGDFNIGGTTTVAAANVIFNSPITNLGGSLVINGQFAILDLGSSSVTVHTLNLRQGTLTGTGIMEVNGSLEWNDGSMTGAGTTIARSGVFFNGLYSSSSFDTLDRTLDCFGNSWVQTPSPYQGDFRFGRNAALNIMPGAVFNGSRLGILGSTTSDQNHGTLTNYGTLVIDDAGLNRGMGVYGANLVNDGVIQITNSTLDVRSAIDAPAFIQDTGSIQLQNGNIGESLQLNGGSLSGYGSVGNIVSNAVIAPSGGNLNSYQGTLALQSNSVLTYSLNGSQPGISYGQIVNVSTATLNGTLQISLSRGFQKKIKSSNTFTLLSAQTITGEFSNVASGGRLSTEDGRGSFLVTYDGTSVVLSKFKRNKFKRGH
jgi:hypothetical protein